jgi:hypothetical protein
MLDIPTQLSRRLMLDGRRRRSGHSPVRAEFEVGGKKLTRAPASSPGTGIVTVTDMIQVPLAKSSLLRSVDIINYVHSSRDIL